MLCNDTCLALTTNDDGQIDGLTFDLIRQDEVDVPTAVVGSDECADVTLDLQQGKERCTAFLDADSALALAETLTLYANASKRIAARAKDRTES